MKRKILLGMLITGAIAATWAYLPAPPLISDASAENCSPCVTRYGPDDACYQCWGDFCVTTTDWDYPKEEMCYQVIFDYPFNEYCYTESGHREHCDP